MAGQGDKLKKITEMIFNTDDSECSCDETFALMGQYSEILIEGGDPSKLLPHVKKHLHNCPCCEGELHLLLDMIAEDTPK